MSPHGRRGPGAETTTEPASKIKAAAPPINTQQRRSGPVIGGRVVVNARWAREWSFKDDDRVDRVIKELEWAPAGAHVTIVVAARQLVPVALDYLREHASHLGAITVECSDPETVARWVRGLRDGVAVTHR